MMLEIEARASSVVGRICVLYGNTPTKGDTAEVFVSFPRCIFRYNAEYALYCRF